MNPIEEMARFLVGAERVRPRRPAALRDRRGGARAARSTSPSRSRGTSSRRSPRTSCGRETYDRVAELVREHRATLVFVNTRRLAERAAHALARAARGGRASPRTTARSRGRAGSDAEERLKAGELRAVVATASLELGIDVGDVDLVVQLGSPGALARRAAARRPLRPREGRRPEGPALPDEPRRARRVRRAGARPARAARSRRSRIPDRAARRPRAADRRRGVRRRRSTSTGSSRSSAAPGPTATSPRAEFDAVVDMLSEGIATAPGRTARAPPPRRRERPRARAARRAHRRAHRRRRHPRHAAVRGRRRARGARGRPGRRGLRRREHGRRRLPARQHLLAHPPHRGGRRSASRTPHGAAPGIPFWLGEAPGRSRELSAEVSALREELERRLDDRAAAAAWLAAECAVPEAGARQVGRVPRRDAAPCSAPSRPSGRSSPSASSTRRAGCSSSLHAPFGARTNRAFGLALRKRFCRTLRLRAAGRRHRRRRPPLARPAALVPARVDLRAALRVAPWTRCSRRRCSRRRCSGVRWRWNATRALAIPRLFKGKRMPPPIARMRADDLLAAVFPHAGRLPGQRARAARSRSPTTRSSRRRCATASREAMDAAGLRGARSAASRAGEVRLVAVDTAEPSPMSHEILGARPWAYLDDAPLEERRARAVALRRALPGGRGDRRRRARPGGDRRGGGAGLARSRATPTSCTTRCSTSGSCPRAEGERARARSSSRSSRPAARRGSAPAAARVVGRRGAGRARAGGRAGARDLDASTAAPTALLEPDARPASPLRARPRRRRRGGARGRARLGAAGRADHRPRRSPRASGSRPSASSAALAGSRPRGVVLRGRFLPGAPWSPDAPHWCERSVLARIHRLTLGRLRARDRAGLRRRPAPLPRALAARRARGRGSTARAASPRWSGSCRGSTPPPARGSASSSRRASPDYERGLLDELCLAGEVAWGRLAVARRAGRGAAPPERADAQRAVTLALREDLAVAARRRRAGAPPPLGAVGAGARRRRSRRRGASLPPRPRRRDRPAARRGRGRRSGSSSPPGSSPATASPGCARSSSRRRAAGPSAARARPAGAGRSCARRRAAARRPPARPRRAPLDARAARAAVPRAATASCSATCSRARARRRPGASCSASTARSRRAARSAAAASSPGFTGEQFALPEAVDALRAVRRAPREGAERVEVSAADPLNLVGILTPGARVPAVLGQPRRVRGRRAGGGRAGAGRRGRTRGALGRSDAHADSLAEPPEPVQLRLLGAHPVVRLRRLLLGALHDHLGLRRVRALAGARRGARAEREERREGDETDARHRRPLSARRRPASRRSRRSSPADAPPPPTGSASGRRVCRTLAPPLAVRASPAGGDASAAAHRRTSHARSPDSAPRRPPASGAARRNAARRRGTRSPPRA